MKSSFILAGIFLAGFNHFVFSPTLTGIKTDCGTNGSGPGFYWGNYGEALSVGTNSFEYAIYYGGTSFNYTNRTVVQPRSSNFFSLFPGTYYFNNTTIDTNGNEGPLATNETIVTITNSTIRIGEN